MEDDNLQITLFKENIFYDDFDLNDIDPKQLITGKIFTEQQYKDLMEVFTIPKIITRILITLIIMILILKQVTERKEQIKKLLFYLSYKTDKEIKIFLNIIEPDYSWLVKQLIITPDLDKSAISHSNIMVVKRNLPKFSNVCIHRTKYVTNE